MKKVPQLKFNGFRTPKYTQVPDQLFDELLAELLGTELKVLLYIMRRTFGFKRDSDAISLSQMLRGITTRKGIVLDRGAGLSKPTLLKALRSLQEKNIIRTERRRSRAKGDEPTVYSLVFADERGGQKIIPPVVKEFDQGGGKGASPGPVVKEPTTQETVDIQDTVIQQQGLVAALKKIGISAEKTKGLLAEYAPEYLIEKFQILVWTVRNDKNAIKKTPAAFFIDAVKKDYDAPPQMSGGDNDKSLWNVLEADEGLSRH